MATLTVWKFGTPEGADQALGKLEQLQKQNLIEVLDAAVVSWPEDKSKPKTRELGRLTGPGALWGGFWGLLFGLIFFMPLIGAAVGAAMGALAGHFTKVGIDEDFIKDVRSKVTEGTSALFLLTGQVTEDKVLDEFQGADVELIQSNLSKEQEAELRAAFGADE